MVTNGALLASHPSSEGIAVEHTLVQVRTIARTLFDSAVEGGIADSTKKQIAVALSAASYAISAHVDLPDDINDFGSSPTDDAREAGSALAETLIEEGKEGAVAAEPIARDFLLWWGKKYLN